MKQPVFGRGLLLLLMGWMFASGPVQAADANLAVKATAILNVNCRRCHGQDGTAEGGMNFILDTAKLVARKKIIPGNPDQSPLFKKLAAGKMPPAGERASALRDGRCPRQAMDRSRRSVRRAGRPATHPHGRGRVQPASSPTSKRKSRAAGAFSAISA